MGMRTITFKADAGLAEMLDRVAERLGWNRSTVIRAALVIGLSALEANGDSGCPGSRYQCPFCGETLCGFTRFREHVLEAHVRTDGGYRCPACSRVYATRRALVRHAAENLGDGLHDLVYALTISSTNAWNRPRSVGELVSRAIRRARVDGDEG